MNLEKRTPKPPTTGGRGLPKPPHEGVIRVAAVRPARALTVYVLIGLMLIAYLLGAVAFLVLYHRTQQVCEPLRSGAALATQTTTDAGRGFAQTFGDSADQLGCPR